MNRFLLLLSAAFVLSVCGSTFLMSAVGPENEMVESGAYHQVRYVSIATGQDEPGAGRLERPWATIGYALYQINDAGPKKTYAVFVATGRYAGQTVDLRPYISLFGGFNPADWERDIFRFRTILDGEDKRRVVDGADHARIDGFHITGGNVRGFGAGILCKGNSPVISNNIIFRNRTLGPQPWNPKFRHEQANDGGGIACTFGGSPIIIRNLITENETEIGRGAGIACHHHSSPSIAKNVVTDNYASTNDPARSGDGGGISVFGYSHPVVSGNVIAGNRALSENDGGGIFLTLWCAPLIEKNIIVGNDCGDDGGGIFIGGQEHRYDRPYDPLPPKDEFLIILRGNIVMGNRNRLDNSGAARITMDTHFISENNIFAHNSGGLYLQRSEFRMVNDTIIDDFYWTELREGFKAGHVINSILTGTVKVDAPIQFENCVVGKKIEGSDLIVADPGFSKDGFRGTIGFMEHSPVDFTTVVRIKTKDVQNLERNLSNRVIKIGDRWGVIRDNKGDAIRIWGNLTVDRNTSQRGDGAPLTLEVIQSFHISPGSPCIDTGKAEISPYADIDGVRRNRGKPGGQSRIDIGADELVY